MSILPKQNESIKILIFDNHALFNQISVVCFIWCVLKKDCIEIWSTLNFMKIWQHNVVYIQACNSDSMFEGASTWQANKNIFVTISTNSTHSCYACNYVQAFDTCLSNMYDRRGWMIHKTKILTLKNKDWYCEINVHILMFETSYCVFHLYY